MTSLPPSQPPSKLATTPERDIALRKIQRLMDFWRINPQELQGALPKVSVSAVTPDIGEEDPSPQKPQSYRHPRYGQVWNGRGPQPQWLKDALIQEGYTVAELRAAD